MVRGINSIQMFLNILIDKSGICMLRNDNARNVNEV